HLAQHRELSLLAIGLGTHLQSLPKGAPADIKTLTARFPEGATRIAAALRELERHGYLRRARVRTPSGRIVTRTVSCHRPGPARLLPRVRPAPTLSSTVTAPAAPLARWRSRPPRAPLRPPLTRLPPLPASPTVLTRPGKEAVRRVA